MPVFAEEESKGPFMKPSKQQPSLLVPNETPDELVISQPFNEFITADGIPLCDWD